MERLAQAGELHLSRCTWVGFGCYVGGREGDVGLGARPAGRVVDVGGRKTKVHLIEEVVSVGAYYVIIISGTSA